MGGRGGGRPSRATVKEEKQLHEATSDHLALFSVWAPSASLRPLCISRNKVANA